MESHDFEQIARRIVQDRADRNQLARECVIDFAEQLRLVWNARGAADIATAESVLLEPGDNCNTLNAAIRALDR